MSTPHNTKPPPSISKPPHTTSKSPPPSHPLPEETVKEVLTESVPKPHRVSSPFIKSAPLLTKNGTVYQPLPNEEPSEEVSEIYSTISESVSVSNDDMFREVRHKSPVKVKNRSYSGEVRPVGRSPCRVRSEPSPGRVRSEPSPGRVRSGSGNGRRRENGESSGRRSRSPVTRVDSGSGSGSAKGLGRTQSTRRTGKSPSRVGSGPGDRVRRLGQEDPHTSNELLENPLVSLECFIFL